MKMFSRVGTWVMLGFFLLMILLNLIASPTDLSSGFSDFLSGSVTPMSIITLLACIWSAGIMTSEFSTGTVKLLMIRPVTRTKILWAKYTLVVIYTIILTVSYYAFIILLGLMIYGDASLADPNVILLGQAAVLKFIEALFIITLTYMVAVLSHNRSLAMGISLFFYYASNIVGFFLQNKPWAKYLFFMHLDLTGYVITSISLTPHTEPLSFALCVLGAYFIAFLVITWYSFAKRDVVN